MDREQQHQRELQEALNTGTSNAYSQRTNSIISFCKQQLGIEKLRTKEEARQIINMFKEIINHDTLNIIKAFQLEQSKKTTLNKWF